MVNVLISTYNGEKYIQEQIESILAQTYQSFHIYIRDDGSSDGTWSKLQQYKDHENITLVKGDNRGYGYSFLSLLKQAEAGDYWAYCDQDDVWYPDKLETAVNILKTMPQDQPNMYFHNFELTNEQLEPTGIYQNKIKGYCFRRSITECLHMGFATVMNRKLRDFVLRGDIEKIPTHDWWTELVVMAFGTVYTDDQVLAKHRRLDSSVSGMNMKNRLKWLKATFQTRSDILILGHEFVCVYDDLMIDKKERNIIDLFNCEKYSLIKSIKKCLYPKRWRGSIVSELVCRFLMLIGRM